MATRQYGQYCAIAKALDVLGDRWALLIVRELLFGPLRYSELQAALPGIATDMLAARLRELESTGVISRGDDARHYELTGRGRDLRPVLEALAVWGLGELDRRSPEDSFDAKWMAIPLSAMVQPDRAAGVILDLALVTDGEQVALRLADGQVTLGASDGAPDVTIKGPAEALAAAVSGRGSRFGRRLRVSGEPRHVNQLLYVLGLSDRHPRAGRRSR